MVSIIVPVYNVEKYLDKCIDSILDQTFTDFELLLVNDGSTDNSGNICDEYAKKDNRIRVFHQENNGVSSARNKGLRVANREWITFIDSDDDVAPRYIEDLIMDSNKSTDTSFVCQSFSRIGGAGIMSVFSYNFYDILKFDNYNELFQKLRKNSMPFPKLYKRGIIADNNLVFDEKLTYSEDKLFILEYISKCKGSIVFSNIVNYRYHIRSGSLTNKLLKPENYWDPYVIFKQLMRERFDIDYNREEYRFLYNDFTADLHMFINSVFVYKGGREFEYLKKLDIEDWRIYKIKSSLGRKVFDFFLFQNIFFVPRLIAKYFIKPHFIK